MKAAIIGTGRMGRSHIQVVQELGLDLAGICDRSPQALALAFQEKGISPALHYQVPSVLLETVMPECVIIATTAPSHCELTCMAAKAGANYILCEKPMATSLAECDQMIAVCREHDVRLAINHQMRFMELYALPKSMLMSEEYQGLQSMTVITGNFGLAMNGTHCIEAFRFLTDEAPIEVTAWLSDEKVPNPRGLEFEDRAGSLRMKTRTGKRFYLEAGADQGHGITMVYSGRNGQIVVDTLSGLVHTSVRKPKDRDLPTTQYATPSLLNSFSMAASDAIEPSKAVLKSLLHNANYPDGITGKQAIAALVAAHISDERSHVPVRIDESLPADRVFPWA